MQQVSYDQILEQLKAGHVCGLPIEELQVLEKIKDHCFLEIGPLAVGIDMKQELFILRRDPNPTGDKWY